jgi:hypothetical protein
MCSKLTLLPILMLINFSDRLISSNHVVTAKKSVAKRSGSLKMV